MDVAAVDLGLRGKTALVSGGTRGVGRGIVLSLARQGVHVVTCYRRPGDMVESLRRELAATSGQHLISRADVTDPDQVRELLTRTRDEYGHLDLVVANVGAFDQTPYGDLDLAEWQRIIATNLTSTHLLFQAALPLLRKGSSVVGISTKAIESGVPRRAHYTAAKAGVVGLCRSLAREFGDRGIRFNVLSLGMIETEWMHEGPEEQFAAMAVRYGSFTALGRLGTPDEVAGAVSFLASDLASFVTGSVVPVDGGIG